MAIPTRQKFEQVLKLNPNSIIFAHLAYSCLQEGDIDRAFSLCEGHMVNHKKYAFGHFVYGAIGLEKGDYELARAELEASVYLDPSNLKAWRILAEVYTSMNDTEKIPLVELMIGRNTGSTGTSIADETESITPDEMETVDFLEDTTEEFLPEENNLTSEMDSTSLEEELSGMDLDSGIAEEESVIEDEILENSAEEKEITSLDDLPPLEEMDESQSEDMEIDSLDDLPSLDELDEELDGMSVEDLSDQLSGPSEEDLIASDTEKENSDTADESVTDEDLNLLDNLGDLDELSDTFETDDMQSLMEDTAADEDIRENRLADDLETLLADDMQDESNQADFVEPEAKSDDAVAEELDDQPYETVQLDAMFDDGSEENGKTDLTEIQSEPVESSPKTLTSTLGEIYISQGKFQEALQVFEKLLENNPDNRRFQRKVKELKELIEMNSL